MISTFPNFKTIDLDYKEEIESFYKSQKIFLSDHSFLNLWFWSRGGKNKVAKLNNNLVFLLSDYEDDCLKLSFLGENGVNETVHKLLDFAELKGIEKKLYYIPEKIAKKLPSEEFLVKKDIDNLDYIFSPQEISELKGKNFISLRRFKNIFLRNFSEIEFLAQESSEVENVNELMEVFEVWAQNKGEKEVSVENERKALECMVSDFCSQRLILSKVLVKEKIAAFSIDEILSDNFALSHFFKADFRIKGVSEFLNCQTADFLHKEGIKYWNWEQDLGIEGLRKNKERYKPIKYLNKYTVEKVK